MFEASSELAPNVFGASSELAPNVFGASSELAPNVFGASSELASVMEFGFYEVAFVWCCFIFYAMQSRPSNSGPAVAFRLDPHEHLNRTLHRRNMGT